VALFRRNNNEITDPEPIEPQFTETGPAGRARKEGPTPTRKEAEALRRQRVTRTLTKKQARQEASRSARSQRMRQMAVRDNTPEKALLRNYIDARWNIGEFLLPSLVVILALTFLNQVWPIVTLVSTVVMYLFLLLVLFDVFLMWRGFKRLLAQRLPNAPTRGLLMYGMNRCIQIRRFRVPPVQVKRGEAV
jgi:hypothetical protein